jgi:hypothetical protein
MGKGMGYEFAILALTNSALFKYMVNIQCSASAFEIGTVQRTPFPPSFENATDALAEFGRVLTRQFSVIATIDETATDFHLALPCKRQASISEAARAIENEFTDKKKTAGRLLCELDDFVEQLYGLFKGECPENEYHKMVEPLELVNTKKEAKRLDQEIEKQENLLAELRDFEDKLRKAANLHLVPDLNDGVVLNIAPLYELVPWKEAKKYWEELLDGKYEWSSIGKQLREKGLVK